MLDGFDADLDAAGGFGGVEVTEFEEEGAGGFDDFLSGGVGGLVHAAFVAGEADDAGDPRAAGGDFGAPEDFIGVAAVGGGPDVGDVEGGFDVTGAKVGFEEPVQEIRIVG